MKRRSPRTSAGRSRPGKTLVMFALLLPVLLGMVGLVIDGGLMIAAQRAAQNAADAAAMAAAMASLSGQGDPQTFATTYVTQYNGPSDATLTTFNNPPNEGPHAGSSRHYEVVVTCPITTLFMPVLRVERDQCVRARAVAGYEAVPAGDTVAALDPTASPGLAVTGGARLIVNGRISVSSTASPAATVDGDSEIEAAVYLIAGGTKAGTFSPYPGTRGALLLGQPAVPDPLINLPTPATTASMADDSATPLSPSWNTRPLGSPSVTAGYASGLQSPNYVDAGGTVQLYPGVYQSIGVAGGKVNFNPGVYILSPSNDATNALDVAGGTVTGDGVMFYNTGGDFVPSTGYPDHDDASLYDPGPSGMNAPPSSQSFQGNFAGINIDASNADSISFSALSADGDPFSGMLLYQRRANSQAINITGGNLSLAGTLYAKWARLNLSGGGNHQAQFIVGSMRSSGPSTVTLTAGYPGGRADQVFLAE
jgi:hypothetical protein